MQLLGTPVLTSTVAVTLWAEDFSGLVVFGVVQKMATLLQLVLVWFGFLVFFSQTIFGAALKTNVSKTEIIAQEIPEYLILFTHGT